MTTKEQYVTKSDLEEVLKPYATKADLEAALDRIDARLDQMDTKLDGMGSKLDTIIRQTAEGPRSPNY